MSLAIMPTPEQAAILKSLGFKSETAYIEVPRCATCKNWERHRPGPFETREITNGACCGGTGPSGVYVECGEATLSTEQDFGCVQWEAKP